VIDETLTAVLGAINVKIIYSYLEKKGCPREKIPQNLDLLSDTLRALLGPGRGQILGAASILEETIARAFADKLGVEFKAKRPICFSAYIEELRRTQPN
jgi:hypothetical protein